MKYLFINSVCGIRSTGRICADLARELEAQGNECRIAYGRVETVPERDRKYAVRIGTDRDLRLHALQTRLFDTHGFGSKKATAAFLRWADAYDPDVLWLHNLHGYYINVELLFAWIRSRPGMQVKWTLHDCWAFTGHCTHFAAAGCVQWRTRCTRCPQLRRYPACCGISDVGRNFDRKKAAFTGVSNMTLFTPSAWLAGLVRESFLREYPVEVRRNTIDTRVFRPTPGSFRVRFGLQDKTVVLGVASTWDDRKGLGDLIRLAGMLDGGYAVVLAGLSEKQLRGMQKRVKAVQGAGAGQYSAVVTAADAVCADEAAAPSAAALSAKEAARAPDAVIPPDVRQLYRAVTGRDYAPEVPHAPAVLVCLARTNSAQELAALYTAADVFANPTREDTYPTVNLEARACGTRVVTYDTGGSAETLLPDTAPR